MIISHASVERFSKEILLEKGINGIKGRVVAKKSHGMNSMMLWVSTILLLYIMKKDHVIPPKKTSPSPKIIP